MAKYEQFGEDGEIVKKRCCSWGRCLCATFVLLVFCLIIIIIAFVSYNRYITSEVRYRYPAVTGGPFPNAVVQSQHEACSAIGVDVLRRNGSVVDAAVAVQFCTGIMLPESCGLGGGFFMTIYAAPNNGSDERFVNTIVARDQAPAAILNYSSTMAFSGGMSIAAPGEPLGLHGAWRAYGRLPWVDLVTPTIQLLENGVVITGVVANVIQTHEKFVRRSPGLRALFVHPDGRLKGEGDVYFNPALVNTLRLIAAVEDQSVYHGSLPADMAADIQDAGGIVTEEDIRRVLPRFESPVVSHLPYKNITMYSPPPPSSGVIVQFILHLLDGFNSTFSDETLSAQRSIEAFKFGYAQRSRIGDPRFIDVQQVIDNLTNADYVESIHRKICDSCTLPFSAYGADFLPLPDSGTCGHTVIGPDGSAVATTATISAMFGSKVVGQRTGIIFNNVMDDFSSRTHAFNSHKLPPLPTNLPQPGKSPLSCISPSLIFNSDGDVFVGINANGGSTIISQIAEVVLQYAYRGHSLADAISRPRFTHSLLPNILYHEQDYPQEILEVLRGYGQQNQEMREEIANVGMAVSICTSETPGGANTNCQRFGASDGRRNGGVNGF